ncbi:MAG: helix-turn-helix transcriptional regulator [Bacillota bacterium]
MPCKGTPFEQFLQQAMTKVRMMLPQSIEVNLERALDTVSFHAEPLRGEEVEVAERYQLLTQAIEDRRAIVTDYYTASRQALSRRKIEPYHLRLFDGAWYCIGYCHERREVRTFALDRMTALGVTGEVPYIRGRQWHHSQTLEELPDGTLRMTLTVGGLGEVMRWVMSLGSHAWVVEPEELRERIAREVEAVGRRYTRS